MKIKKLILIAAWTGLSGWLTALEVQYSAEIVNVGEPLSISISDDRSQPKLARALPVIENGGWLQDRSQTLQQSTIGRTTYTIVLQIVAAHPGELVIPPIELAIGKQKVSTEPKIIKVLDKNPADANLADPAKGLSARMVLKDPARKVYYLDEEIPFDIELLIAPNLEVRQLTYPTLDIPKSVFADYAGVNADNNKFDRPQQTRIERDGKLFHAVKFPGKFRMLGIGKPAISGEVTVGVASPGGRSANRPRGFDDEFFDRFFDNARSVPYTVKIAVPEDLEVIAPPAAPPDVCNLNLIGDWKLSGSFDSDTAKVGEPLTLELKLTGNGSTETLKLPKLNVSEFRVYPPEFKNISDHVWSIKIVLIPLKEGEIPFAASFATFDPAQQKYRTFEIKQTLHIQKGTLAQAGAGANFIPEQVAAVPDADDTPTSATQDLHYLKAQPYGRIKLPLGTGDRLWIILLLIAGPVIAGAIHWGQKHLDKRRNNPALLRRREAIAHKKALLHELQNAAETRQLLNGKLSDFLINYYNLAPGCTVHELTCHVKNDELKTILKSLEDAAYAPTAPVGEEVRQKLCAIIKKLSLFLVLTLALGTLPLNAAAPVGFTDGNQRFAEGNFKGAVEAYSPLLDLDNPDPYLLYNLGCAKFQTGDLPGALRDFEEAHLLLPCDRQILDNLNISRTKALLPKLHEVKSPGDLLANIRDLLRPDQWLLLAAWVWFLAWVVCFAVKKHRIWIAGLAALIIAAALANVWWQQNGAYHPARLIILKAAELRNFPNSSAKVELTLPAGTDAKLLDRKDDYCFIDSGGKTGWIKAADARKYFNN